MDRLQVTVRNERFEIEGFPEAAKAITFDSPRLKKLSHYWLHHLDLEFAAACLKDLNSGKPIKATTSEALWRSALVHYFKCFGKSKSRSSLDAGRILKRTENGIVVHKQLKALRDKHIVHDENPFSSVTAGVILNRAGMRRKIAKVVCVSNHLQTLNQETWNHLRLLIETTNIWVMDQFDRLCENLTRELEQLDYRELMHMENMKIEVYSWDAVSDLR